MRQGTVAIEEELVAEATDGRGLAEGEAEGGIKDARSGGSIQGRKGGYCPRKLPILANDRVAAPQPKKSVSSDQIGLPRASASARMGVLCFRVCGFRNEERDIAGVSFEDTPNTLTENGAN
jgi:hypothetical protein